MKAFSSSLSSLGLRLVLIVALPSVIAEAQGRSDVAVGITPTGAQRFSPGGWSSVAVNGVNPTAEDREETVAVYLGDDPSLQFAKRFWIPAGARRTTWLPILIPQSTAQPVDRQSPARTLLSMMRLNETERGEEFTANSVGMPITSRSLMMTTNEINTAVMVGRNMLDGSGLTSRQIDRIYDTIYAGRDSTIESSLDLSLINLGTNFLPPTAHSLDEIDQIVIATDHILTDSTGVSQLRSWLHDGGRIWVMLELAGEEVVRELLGDASGQTILDSVALNEFDLVTRDPISNQMATERWESELPVEMVRVLTDADEVVATIDGWPAAYWQPVGRGELLITTLGARGWINRSDPMTAYHRIATRFFDLRIKSLQQAEAMIPMLDDQIGYEIPSRTWAAMVLGVNLMVILVAGGWWARQRRLERLAFLLPASALATTAFFLMEGSRQVQSVPSTVATGQLVRVLDKVEEAQVDAVQAIYSQDSTELGLVSAPGNLTLPLPPNMPGEIRRVRWDDSGESRWQGTDQPPGVVRYAQSQSTVPLPNPIVARATFDDRGMQLRVDGLPSDVCEDAVVIAPPAPSTAALTAESSGGSSQLAATMDDLLAPNQFIGGALLTDDQRLRQQVMRQLLSSADQRPFGSEPALLFWTEPLDIGVEVADRFERKGSALMGVPLRIDRPESGTRYQIPATLVEVQTYRGSRGVSSVFDPRTGKWLTDLTKPTEIQLECRFPGPLAPLRLDSVSMQIKVNAPERALVVKARQEGQPVEVFRRANPSGLIEFTIDQPETLDLTPEGTWWLAVEITATDRELERSANSTRETRPANQGSTTSWQIDYVHVNAAATSL